MGVSGRSTPSNWAPRGFLKDLLLVKILHTQTHTSICVCVFVLIICDSPLGTTAHLINWHLYKWDLITDLYPSFSPLCLSHTFFNTHWFSHCLYSWYLSVFFCSSLSLSLSLSSSVLELLWDVELHIHVRCLVCAGGSLQSFEDAFRHCCLCLICEMFNTASKVKASHRLFSLSAAC